MTLALSRQLSYFITNNWDLFSAFEKVICPERLVLVDE